MGSLTCILHIVGHLIYDLSCAHLIEQPFNQNTGQNRKLLTLDDFLPRWKHSKPAPLGKTSISIVPISAPKIKNP